MVMLKKSITISNEQQDSILKYGSLSCIKAKGTEGNFSSMAQGFIDNCTALINISEKKFLNKGLFNVDEIVFLVDASLGMNCTNIFSYKDQLMIQIRDSVKYRNLELKHNIDVSEFLEKMRCLSEIEAFVLIMKICEYWKNCYEVELDDWIIQNFKIRIGSERFGE